MSKFIYIFGFIINTLILPSSAHAEEKNWYFTFLSEKDIIVSDGIPYTVFQIISEFKDCGNQKLVRGEYETKAEFEKRKSNFSQECDMMRMSEGSYIEKKVNLVYNADRLEFYFDISSSNIDLPSKDRYKYGALIYPNSWYDWGCPPVIGKASTHVGSSADVVISKGYHFGYVENFDCPSVNVKLDAAFFDRSRAIINVPSVFPERRPCSCVSSWVITCDKASCGPNERERFGTSMEFSLVLGSDIKKARQLKTKEKSLRLRIEGSYRVWNSGEGIHFFPSSVYLLDLESNDVIFKVDG